MVATQFTRAERRTLRWMYRRGLGLHPSEPAFQLLGARLSVRWWVGWAIYGPLAVFVGWWIPHFPGYVDGLAIAPKVLISLVPVAVFGVAQMAFVEVCRRLDRRLAAGLRQRISRPQAVSVWTVLGRFATALVGVAVVGHTVIAVVLFRRATTSDAVAYVLGLAVVAAVVAMTLWLIVRRPTVAVDDTALAVDERLRAADALFGLWPMYWAALGLISMFDLHGSRAFPLVTVLSWVLALGASCVWFSHPGERERYGFTRARSRA